MHFREPFKIAYEEVESCPVVLVELSTENLVGLGCAAPDKEVSGETVELVSRVIKEKITTDFLNLPVTEYLAAHEKIQTALIGFPSAQAAVEEAFLNLHCQKYHKKMADLWGGQKRERVSGLMTICIKNLSATLADCQKLSQQGYQTLKLKCGLDWENDTLKVNTVKKSLPTTTQLVIDINQGYNVAQAEKFIRAVNNLSISAIEQPVAATDWKGLKYLHRLSRNPIVADESVITIADAEKLLAGNYVAGVNVKLMKCGGPLNFLKIYELAKQFNKIIMIGCMYESNISITTGLNLALACDLDFVDLDSGTADFADDPVCGGAVFENCFLSLQGELALKK